jgi:hypothetical protein
VPLRSQRPLPCPCPFAGGGKGRGWHGAVHATRVSRRLSICARSSPIVRVYASMLP